MLGQYRALILIVDEDNGDWAVVEGGPHIVHKNHTLGVPTLLDISPELELDGGIKPTNDRGGGQGFKLLVNDDLPAGTWKDRINRIKPKKGSV